MASALLNSFLTTQFSHKKVATQSAAFVSIYLTADASGIAKGQGEQQPTFVQLRTGVSDIVPADTAIMHPYGHP